MPEYQYKCRSCGVTFVSMSRADIPPCPVCGKKATRDYVFQARSSMPEHFNHSIGGYVNNERDLRDALKRRSEEESERVGVDHNYEYVSRADMADASSHGVTDEGLDTTERAHYVAD